MFEKQRLTNANISAYIGEKVTPPNVITNYPSLAQNDYGKDNDCSLTSMTAMIKWLRPQGVIQDYYNQIEKVAVRYGYNGDKWGTIPFFVTRILNTVMKNNGLSYTAKSKYGKNIGFNWLWVKRQLRTGHPLILNFFDDGRGYQGQHTISVVGYLEKNGKHILAVYDNWYRNEVSYLDWDKLNMICSIIYLTI